MDIDINAWLGRDLQLDLSRPFTAAMARSAGLSSRDLTSLVKAALVEHPVRGVYVASEVPDSIERRARCLRLVMPAGCFVTDRSAAYLHGAQMALAPHEDLLVPEVTFFRASDEGRLRNALCRSGERCLRPDDLTAVGGLPVTTPMRTAWDLGRLQTRDVGLAGMDALARVANLDLDELVAGVGRFARQRGVVQLRLLAPRVDPGSESFGESALRNRWWDGGLPRPRTQIPIFAEDATVLFWIDIGLEDLGYGNEYDGADAHAGTEEHDNARREWIAENRGFDIDVFTAPNVFGAAQDADQRMRRGLAAAKASLGQRRHLLSLNRRLGGDSVPTRR